MQISSEFKRVLESEIRRLMEQKPLIKQLGFRTRAEKERDAKKAILKIIKVLKPLGLDGLSEKGLSAKTGLDAATIRSTDRYLGRRHKIHDIRGKYRYLKNPGKDIFDPRLKR